MSEPERPRPEYGEYASSAEQAAALGRSGALPTPVEKSPAGGMSPIVPTAELRLSHQGSPSIERTPSLVDRLVTVFLVTFWAVFVIGDAVSFLNLGESLRAPMKQIGIENYHATELTAGIGIAMLVSQVMLWAVAAVWSYRRLSLKKISWWVPVVLGVLSFIVLVILLGTLLATDPSIAPALTKF